MPGRHHTAWMLEAGGRLYQFDAGECCAWTAHLMKLDILALRALFISHPHSDHNGGLPMLLWNRNKIARASVGDELDLIQRSVSASVVYKNVTEIIAVSASALSQTGFHSLNTFEKSFYIRFFIVAWNYDINIHGLIVRLLK